MKLFHESFLRDDLSWHAEAKNLEDALDALDARTGLYASVKQAQLSAKDPFIARCDILLKMREGKWFRIGSLHATPSFHGGWLLTVLEQGATWIGTGNVPMKRVQAAVKNRLAAENLQRSLDNLMAHYLDCGIRDGRSLPVGKFSEEAVRGMFADAIESVKNPGK